MRGIRIGEPGWARRRPVLLAAVYLFGFAAALPALLAATGHRWPSSVGVAVAISGTLGTTAAALTQDRYKETHRRRESAFDTFTRRSLTSASGRPLLVRQVADPVLLGVHPAVDVDAAGTGDRSVGGEPEPDTRVPAYFDRDADTSVRSLLTTNALVLVVGVSATGKSRTAFEAVTAVLPDHVLLVPDGRADVATALDVAERFGKCVLWLDDLERYVGTGGLTRAGMFRFLNGAGHCVLMCTMRSVEHSRIMEHSAGSREDREFLRDAREVLEQARVVRLDRILSRAELDRAAAVDGDRRITEALRNAPLGVTEFLAAGPLLLHLWHDAWAVGQHPRAASLIAAAVDVRRAGFTGAVPRTLVERLHEGYLQAKGGEPLRPETLEEAWAWATASQAGTLGLLVDSTDSGTTGERRVTVFDYLVDVVDRDKAPDNGVPLSTMTAVVGYCDADEAERLGELAYRMGHYALARSAYLRCLEQRRRDLGAEHPATVRSLTQAAWLARETGEVATAEAELRAAQPLLTRIHGADHPETLLNLSNLSMLLLDLGKTAEAEAAALQVAAIRERVLGPEHPETLVSRSDLSWILRFDKARLPEAEAIGHQVWEARSRVLGPQHPETLLSRSNLAIMAFDQGRHAEGEASCRQTLTARTDALGPDHPHALRSRATLAWMLWRLTRLDEAEPVSREVADAMTRVLGPTHPDTIACQSTRVAVLIGLGRWPDADRLCRPTLQTAAQLLGGEHPRVKRLQQDAALIAAHVARPNSVP